MKFVVSTENILKTVADVLVVGYPEGKFPQDGVLAKIDGKLNGELKRVLKKEGFKGGKTESKLFYAAGRLKVTYVLVLGLGDAKKLDLETLRTCGATAQGVAARIKAKKIVLAVFASAKGITSEEEALALTEGFCLNQYQFTRYLKKTKNERKEVLISCAQKDQKKAGQAIRHAQILSEGVALARDLVNTPAVDMTPMDLARAAKKLKGVRVSVRQLGWIKQKKMGAFLSVAAGSTKNAPCFIEMTYQPRGRIKKRIAIVGKGVTFDSGGYSLKLGKGMENMKSDMAGAAAVIGLMTILPMLKPAVAVSCYIAATENMVDGCARVPGDVCRAMNGKTIELVNMDAEGRLTIADAFVYANKKKPDYLVDIATLTGACLVALGARYTGIMGNDKDLVSALIKAGDAVGEKMWELPLIEEYREEMKSPIADYKNSGTGYAGAITAGLFLEGFVGKTKWAHLDIAGPSWTDKPLAYTPRGGTGVMVRAMAKFLQDL